MRRTSAPTSEYAFYGCNSMADMPLPNGLISIGRGAFADGTTQKVQLR